MRACSAVASPYRDRRGPAFAGSANRFQDCPSYEEQARPFGPTVPESGVAACGQKHDSGRGFFSAPSRRPRPAYVGTDSGPFRAAGIICLRKPIPSTTFAHHFPRWGCRAERPTASRTRGRRPARSAGVDRSPCTAGARSVLSDRRFVARQFGDGGPFLVRHPRLTAARVQGGSHSHSTLTSQRVPERPGTPPGARLGSRTAGPLSGRSPFRPPNRPTSPPMHGLPSIVDRTRLTRRSRLCGSVGPRSARPGTPPHTYVQRNCR